MTIHIFYIPLHLDSLTIREESYFTLESAT